VYTIADRFDDIYDRSWSIRMLFGITISKQDKDYLSMALVMLHRESFLT